MTIDDIKELISKGETRTLELKKTTGELKDGMHTLCAFLNTDALHCRTHEVPDQKMVFLDSREVYHDEVALQDHYVIKANIVSYAKEAIKDVRIHYSINGGNFIDEAMNQYLETSNYTFVFDNLNTGDEVRYYIDAKDHQNNYNIDPTCGSLDPHHFVIA